MIVDAIYKQDPETQVFEGQCEVWLPFQGKRYHGKSYIHKDDKDFFSEKVGLNIALSRARISVLKDKYKEARQIAQYKNQMYQEALEFGRRDCAEVDPTGAFKAKVDKANIQVKRLHDAIAAEQKGLSFYLKSLDEMMIAIRKQREKDKNK